MSLQESPVNTYTDEVSLAVIFWIGLGICALPAIGFGLGMIVGYLVWG